MSANKSESASQRDSNQPAPASAPIIEEGGADYKPPTTKSGEVAEESTATEGGATIGQQELNELDQENILDDEKGVQTRGIEQDVYAKEKELDEAVGADE